MPAPIERIVKLGNMRFVHNSSQFQPEYFMFTKKLLSCNLPVSAPVSSCQSVDGIPVHHSGAYTLIRKIVSNLFYSHFIKRKKKC